MIAGGVYFIVQFMSGFCANTLHSQIYSPNQKHKVVAFQRDCGATTAYSTQISILDADDKFTNSMSGNIFRVKGIPGDLIKSITWSDDQNIQIQHSRSSQVYEQKTSYGWLSPIYIQYTEVLTLI